MQVWIVIEGYSYEGYGEPIAVFSTREKAEQTRLELLNRTHSSYFVVDVFEYELDAMPVNLE